ncbi:MAG: carboxymuconolactone decarboxylase family protein [Alphaproteobacteria bacterium]|nr:carboxymuconolactone decarboxylase family protein [Alphaproteobacteria bacterium]
MASRKSFASSVSKREMLSMMTAAATLAAGTAARAAEPAAPASAGKGTMPETPITRVPRDKMPPHMQRSWDGASKLHGDTTYVEAFGNNPEVYDWYNNDFYKKLFASGRIDNRILQLVRLRLANVHGCAFCNRSDRVAAREAGIPEEQIQTLAEYETGPFSEREKAALALADVMVLTNPKGMLTKAIYTRARQHFTDGELMELGMIMAVLCGVAKFIFAYDLVEKEDYCPFL